MIEKSLAQNSDHMISDPRIKDPKIEDRLSDNMILRPARSSDIDNYLAMAKAIGSGMTNVPYNQDILAQRIAKSMQCFADPNYRRDGEYLFMLEVDGKVIGSSLIFSCASGDKGFFNFKKSKHILRSEKFKQNFEHDAMTLVHDFDSLSEIGGLLANKEYRGYGIGRLLSLGRFLFIHNAPQLVTETIFAELRGVTKNKQSPFWNDFGVKFFGTDFSTADDFCALHGNNFIYDLLPSTPFYTCLLSDKAKAVLGVPHKNARPAFKLLQSEGFIYDNYFDIFDAGPLIHNKINNIRCIKRTQTKAIKTACGQEVFDGEYFLFHSNNHNFRALERQIFFDDEYVYLDENTQKLLKKSAGEEIQISPKR